MISNLIAHLRTLLATLQRLLHTPAASFLNITIIGIALSLPVGGYVLLKSLQQLGGGLSSTPQISLYLAADTSASEVARIGEKLKQHAAIEHIDFISRSDALQHLQQASGLADVTGGLNRNPLPDAYIVQPKLNDAMALESLRDELNNWPHLEQVQLDSAWAHRLQALIRFGRWTVVILAALLSFALVAITFNTIRLQILTRREEIEVTKLIGANDSFIRRPFLYFGFIQGLFGGIAAWMIVSASTLLLNLALDDLALLYSSHISLASLSLADSFTLLGFSAYLGWLGAWFSVSQHLWQIEPR
ncbi:MAG: ABC transporter permease [Sideroxydans sp.]|nr:ABC transporter permease [Sideroxydans sp.]NOT99157.1 ABC transporter permease [Sideroxydans sp.]